MQSFLTFLAFLLASESFFAQIPRYYSDIDFSQSGEELKEDLQELITQTHTESISYKQVWEVLQQSDIDPNNERHVLLLYGYENGQDNNVKNDRSRNLTNKGGGVGQWNREHVYPRSKGSPNLGSSGPGSDAHMLRPTDVQFNGSRGNLPFSDGTGNAHRVSNSWFPGDEWKGDVARIMMYMYLRYGERCDPNRVAVGKNSYHPEMPDIFLEWNREDPVSDFERNRNHSVAQVQKNRNPFIDNPHLATQIWGGPPAENTWKKASKAVKSKNKTKQKSIFSVSPNPTADFVEIDSDYTIEEVCVYDAAGKLLRRFQGDMRKIYLPKRKGVYWLEVLAKEGMERIKIVKV